MDHDYLFDLPRFEHKPAHMPREGLIRENVFYENWVKLLKSEDSLDDPANQKFADILGSYGHRLNERAATVAASFVTWLGTNLGSAYLHEARKFSKTQNHDSGAYLMVWAMTNVRVSNVSHGLRQLELCLVVDRNKSPELSSADYEVVEHLVMWLGRSNGQRFLAKCEEEYTRRQKVEDFHNYLANSLKLNATQVNQVLTYAKDYKPLDEK